MARGQFLSLILARQHQKVADPWSKTIAVFSVLENMDSLRFYGVRQKLQRLQRSESNEQELLDSDYECPDYGKSCDLF